MIDRSGQSLGGGQERSLPAVAQQRMRKGPEAKERRLPPEGLFPRAAGFKCQPDRAEESSQGW